MDLLNPVKTFGTQPPPGQHCSPRGWRRGRPTGRCPHRDAGSPRWRKIKTKPKSEAEAERSPSGEVSTKNSSRARPRAQHNPPNRADGTFTPRSSSSALNGASSKPVKKLGGGVRGEKKHLPSYLGSFFSYLRTTQHEVGFAQPFIEGGRFCPVFTATRSRFFQPFG